MKIFFISPIGFKTPNLFDSFEKTFQDKGHSIVTDIKDADVIFFDMFSGLGTYDEYILDKALDKEVPIICFDATDFGAMSKEKWFLDDSVYNDKSQDKKFVRAVIYNEIAVVYFMRKMDKTKKYCPFVYPYELCYYKDHDFKPVSKEELFNRPNDICFIGNTSPTRENVINGLKDYFKCDFSLGQERIPHEEWLNRHRQSKMFLEACGGGFGSERPYQLITIAPMLRVHSNHLIHEDFLDGEDCWEINEIPSEVNIESLKFLLNSQVLYQIYLAGIERMKTYFNEEYRANYILSVLKQEGIC